MATEAVRAWQDLLAVTPTNVRHAVADVVRDGAETLTEEFYDRMMRSERATPFLDQERVQKRLRASLQRWMTELFEVRRIWSSPSGARSRWARCTPASGCPST